MMALATTAMFETWSRNVPFGCMYACTRCFSVSAGTRTMEDARVPIEADATWTTPGGRYFSRFCFDAAGHKTKDDLKFNDTICRCSECNLGYADD